MQAESAANSDSTSRYSHGVRAPVRTRSERLSTMCVCGEIGYAAITSGRHRATASATAREPSSCLRTSRLPRRRRRERIPLLGGGRVSLADVAGEPTADRRDDRLERHDPCQCGEAPEQRGVRQGPPDVPPRDLARRDGERALRPEATDEREETE